MFGVILRNLTRKNIKHCSSLAHLENTLQRRLCAVAYKIELKVRDTPVNKYLESLQSEYENLQQKGEVNSKRFTSLQPIMEVLKERNDLVSCIQNLKELLNDQDTDIRALAEEERRSYEEKISAIDEVLLDLLLPVDVDDSKSIVLEINAGVGGQEAMLFAEELFQMYSNFINYKGWEMQIVDLNRTEIGGLRHASAIISGRDVFRHFKYEAGVHRVQRIPATEKSGRIHTSTVSILALPQPDDVEISIDERDVKIETKRASGAGGQHVNTTDSAVRVTHLPTGVTVDCQVDRSQHKNRQIALQKLRALLYQKEMDEQAACEEATRKSQVRSSLRSEKIRTYNFNQDRITDHRLKGGSLHNLKGFLVGEAALEGLIKRLDQVHREEALLNLVNSVLHKR